MNTNVFFHAAGDERGTPKDFFETLNAEFHFQLDCAASPLNHKCELWFGEGGIQEDALEADWGGPGSVCFLNPPYSVAGAFIAKAREEADKGATVVMLLPVRSDTKYWHKWIYDKSATRVVGGSKHEKVGDIWCPSWGPLVVQRDGDYYPGVRVRYLPGRLNFELTVPGDIRAWIKAHATVDNMAKVIEETGLPKMAIERILDDQPDDCLLDAAPFPSCVVIFTSSL